MQLSGLSLSSSASTYNCFCATCADLLAVTPEGTLDGTLDGTFDGTLHGTLDGTFDCFVDKPVDSSKALTLM